MNSGLDYSVHESSYIDEGVDVGAGTSIWHFCHVLSGSQIGKQCRIGQNVVIGPRAVIGNNVKIQNNVSVYEGVTLKDDVFCGPSVVFTNILTPRSAFPRNRSEDNLTTIVQRGASIGANATIVCGNTIGKHALIGAGAVVTRDVADHAIVYGNPAKQHGWACKCGLSLALEGDVTACSDCGRQYQQTAKGLVDHPCSSTVKVERQLPLISLCDMKQQYLALKSEIDAAMQEVAASGNYILGPNVKAFEHEMAKYCGCEFAISLNSGTDALYLALRALGVSLGDEVITTPFTFVATTEAIGLVGAKPIFVDIDPRTFNIDPSQLEDAITSRTKAILPVHLYGQPCEMDTIVEIANRHEIDLLEDCAQALGASYREHKVGTIGRAGCLSFFPSKNLGCFGDGGMVLTNDPEVYERVELLRRHGGKAKYHHEELGINSRLDELQAAILRIKLKHLDTWNEKRRYHSSNYNQGLATLEGIDCPLEILPTGMLQRTPNEKLNSLIEPVYHQYTIKTEHRERVIRHLNIMNVGNATYYPIPLHLQQVHADLGYRPGDFPCAEQTALQCLSLPIYPELTPADQQQVITAVRESFSDNSIVSAA